MSAVLFEALPIGPWKILGVVLWAFIGVGLTVEIFRMTKQKDSFTPGLDPCPECGAVLKIADPNGYEDRDFVVCEECDWRSEGGDVDWTNYEPPVQD